MKKKVYLTIDDAPSKDFKKKVDFLFERKIPAIFFVIGKLAEKNKEVLAYALKKGFELGNHSYSHKDFSKISFEIGNQEIERTDKILDEIYSLAKIKRKKKYFRFPYGNKGGENAEGFQKILNELGYSKVKFKKVNYSWFKEFKMGEGIDLLWSFDVREYDLKIKEVIRRIDTKDPQQGGDLNNSKSRDILLIHDHDKTTKEFFEIINYLIKKGVRFLRLR